MPESSNALEPSNRLRYFLVGVRLVGLIVALMLVNLHRAPSRPELGDYYLLVTGIVVAYHVFAGILFCKRSKILGLLIAAADLALGFILTYFYGSAYLLLTFTLPVLELGYYLGNVALLTAAVVGGIFYLAVGMYPIFEELQMADTTRSEVVGRLNLSGVQAVLSVLLFWLYGAAIKEASLRAEVEKKAHKEKELLFQELQTKAGEVGQIIGEVGDREAKILELEKQIQEMKAELDATYEELHNARMTSSRLQAMMEEAQERMAEEVKREKQGLEREVLKWKKKLERQVRLLDIFRDVMRSLSLNDTLLAMTAQLQSLFVCQSCVIFLVDEIDGQRELFPEVAASKDTEFFRNLVLQVGEGAPGWVVQNRRSLKIDNRSVGFDGQEITTLLDYEGSALVVPLETDKDVLGAVYLGRSGVDPFSPQDLEMLEEFCALAGLALSNSLEYSNTINRGFHDPCTRLYNALYLQERMREEIMRGRRYTYPVALLLIDVDGFSEVARSLGDETADNVMREIGAVIQNTIRETDVAARLEEDEFGILLVHSDRNAAFQIAERIRTAIEMREFGPAGSKVKLTVSIGVAGSPHDATDDEQLKVRAGTALVQARAMGGNCCAFWDTVVPTGA